MMNVNESPTREARKAGGEARPRTSAASIGPEIRWGDLPRTWQVVLERTPRGQWYRIRPMIVQCPETHKILDLARMVDQILPRSTLGVRRKLASKEERARKAQEMIENLDAFWGAVDALEATLERLARSAGVWGFIAEPRKKESSAPRNPEPKSKPAAQDVRFAEVETDAEEAA